MILRPGQRIATIPGLGVTVTQGRATLHAGGAAAWWLLGSVDAANAIAVYQPKGAASQAASYTDMTGTGNTAVPAPSTGWDGTNGWLVDELSANRQIYVPVNLNSTYSFIVRYVKVNGNRVAGWYGTKKSAAAPYWNANTLYYWNSDFYTRGAAATSGVVAIAGNQAYINGSADGAAFTAGSFTEATTFKFGLGGSVYIQAGAIYNSTLTDTQVGLISAAMAAL